MLTIPICKSPSAGISNLIRNFMVFIGPVSSLFDFLTFYVLLHVFHSSEAQFHTGWFVESLATQTLVLFVIRTSKNPLRSRPSNPLLATCLAVVAIGIYLPFSPLAGMLGFTPLPAAYFAFLAVATGTYLLLVEFAKRRLLSRTTQTKAIKISESDSWKGRTKSDTSEVTGVKQP